MRTVLAVLLLGALLPGMVAAQGEIVAWGDGPGGPPAPNTDFVAAADAGQHCLGLRSDGSIVAWGFDLYGLCDVPEPNTDFVAVAATGQNIAHWPGYYGFSLGLKSGGSIVMWGGSEYDVPAPNTDFIAIAAGALHFLGLKNDGSVVAWGDSTAGQCNVPEPNTDFVAIAAGGWHSLGLKADGSIVAWGSNYDDQGHYVGQCDISAPNWNFRAIAGGYYHSLGLRNDGSIVAWGANAYGQCNVPAPNSDFVAVAAGRASWSGIDDGDFVYSGHCLGLKSSGSIVAWGDNGAGQCDVPEPNAGFVALAAGWQSLGVKGGVVPVSGDVITALRLGSNRPNPFNPSTTIAYEVPATGTVLLHVFDLRGRLVRTLVDEALPAGRHEAQWDGRDGDGRELPSAVYVSRLEAGGTVAMGRMTLVR